MSEPFPKDPRGASDAGVGRDERTAAREELCLARLAAGAYCERRAGHHGEHRAFDTEPRR